MSHPYNGAASYIYANEVRSCCYIFSKKALLKSRSIHSLNQTHESKGPTRVCQALHR